MSTTETDEDRARDQLGFGHVPLQRCACSAVANAAAAPAGESEPPDTAGSGGTRYSVYKTVQRETTKIMDALLPKDRSRVSMEIRGKKKEGFEVHLLVLMKPYLDVYTT